MGTHITKTEEERRKALLAEVLIKVDEMLLAGYTDHITQNHGRIWVGREQLGNPRSWNLTWALENGQQTVFDFQGNAVIRAEAWNRPSSGERLNSKLLDGTQIYEALAGVASALVQQDVWKDAQRAKCPDCGEIHGDGAGAGIFIVAAGIVSYDQVASMAADPYYNYDRRTFTDPTASIGPLDKVDSAEVAEEAMAIFIVDGIPQEGRSQELQ